MRRNSLGALKDPYDTRDHLYHDVVKSLPRVPNVVDFEAQMSEVTNQGAMNSCVAEAQCGMKEWEEMYQRNFRYPIKLSRYFLYSFYQEFPGGGAYPRKAFDILRKWGVPTDKAYPWPADIRTDKVKLDPPKGMMKLFRLGRRLGIQAYMRLRTIDDVFQNLATNSPTFFSVGWDESWDIQNAPRIDGYPVLDTTRNEQVRGGHAMVLVGYDMKKSLFKVRNSWGKGWGNQGYCYMTFRAFENYLWDAWSTYDKSNPLLK